MIIYTRVPARMLSVYTTLVILLYGFIQNYINLHTHTHIRHFQIATLKTSKTLHLIIAFQKDIYFRSSKYLFSAS